MRRLFFVRHGQTKMNVDGVFSGLTETPLTKAGKQQAINAGRHAKTKLPAIDVIISSPYKRAYETAKLIADELGYPADKIETNGFFVERGFGTLEGTTGKDFFASHEYRDIDNVEGAETIEALQDRAAKALNYIKSRKEDNILVVGHGSFGRAFKREVNQLHFSDEYVSYKPIDNAEIVELI